VLACWRAGVLACWRAGVLACWRAGVLCVLCVLYGPRLRCACCVEAATQQRHAARPHAASMRRMLRQAAPIID
jgi:hypothetical protein